MALVPYLLAAMVAASLQVAAAAPQLCAGEFSTCPATGVCALVVEQCKQCGPGEYACPLTTACVATPDDITSCPGLAGTHFDTTLSVEARLDYIFNQALTVPELVSQMTENATEIARLGIPVRVCVCVVRVCV